MTARTLNSQPTMITNVINAAKYLARRGVQVCREHFDNNPFAWGCFLGVATISIPLFMFLLLWGFTGVCLREIIRSKSAPRI